MISKIFALVALYTLPAFTSAQDAAAAPGDADSATKLINPLKVNSVDGLFETILNEIVRPIAIVIAVMFIVWAGLKFVMAQGNPGEIEKARKNLVYVLIGVALVVGAGIILDLLLNTISEITNVTP